MTVANVVPTVNEYNGDGSTTIFNFTFQIMNKSTDLFVNTIVNQIPTPASGYTITLNTPLTLPSTGYITFAVAPLAGTLIRINRNTYEARTTNYVAGPIQPNTLNADIDNTVLMIQDIDSQLIPQDGAGNYNLNGAIIRNSGTPLISTDVATLGSVTTAVAGAVTATTLPSGWINANAPTYGLSTSNTGAANRTALTAAIAAAKLLNTFVTAAPGTYPMSGGTITSTGFLGIRCNGRGTVNFSFSTNTSSQHGMVMTDPATGYVYEGFTITGPGQSTGTMWGLKLVLNANTVTIGRVTDVVFSGWSSGGFYNEVPITSTFTDLESLNCGIGFIVTDKGNAQTAVAGTSTTWISCYANNCLSYGYYFWRHNYATLTGCAADTCNTSYALYQCEGMVLVGCGNESNTYVSTGTQVGIGVYTNLCSGTMIVGHWCYNLPNIASVAYYFDGNGFNNSLLNCTSLTSNVTLTQDVYIVAGESNTIITNLNSPGRSLDRGVVVDAGTGNNTFVQWGTSIVNPGSGNAGLNFDATSGGGKNYGFFSTAGGLWEIYDTTDSGVVLSGSNSTLTIPSGVATTFGDNVTQNQGFNAKSFNIVGLGGTGQTANASMDFSSSGGTTTTGHIRYGYNGNGYASIYDVTNGKGLAQFSLNQAGATINSTLTSANTLTVTTGGLVVSAGGAAITGASSVTGAFTTSSGVGFNGQSAATAPSGFGTPVGGSVIANYNITDAGGANSNSNKLLAEIATALIACGIIKT